MIDGRMWKLKSISELILAKNHFGLFWVRPYMVDGIPSYTYSFLLSIMYIKLGALYRTKYSLMNNPQKKTYCTYINIKRYVNYTILYHDI